MKGGEQNHQHSLLSSVSSLVLLLSVWKSGFYCTDYVYILSKRPRAIQFGRVGVLRIFLRVRDQHANFHPIVCFWTRVDQKTIKSLVLPLFLPLEHKTVLIGC